MKIVFDPKKDRVNRLKHGLSLAEAEDFDMTTALIEVDNREDYGEVRYVALGFPGSAIHSFCFALNEESTDEEVRAISLRRA